MPRLDASDPAAAEVLTEEEQDEVLEGFTQSLAKTRKLWQVLVLSLV